MGTSTREDLHSLWEERSRHEGLCRAYTALHVLSLQRKEQRTVQELSNTLNTMNVSGVPTTALFDTGAQISLINRGWPGRRQQSSKPCACKLFHGGAFSDADNIGTDVIDTLHVLLRIATTYIPCRSTSEFSRA